MFCFKRVFGLMGGGGVSEKCKLYFGFWKEKLERFGIEWSKFR